MTQANQYIDQYQAEFDKAIEHLKSELNSLRTGRAQTTLLENVQVEAYGAFSPLNQLASLSIIDAQSIAIEPYDKSILKDIEIGISKSNLGLSVVNTGEKLIAKVPPMTEENRKDLVKMLGEKVEDTKISIRQIRDKVRELIMDAEKNKEITEDDKYKFLTDLDNYTSEQNKTIDEMAKEKESEIMTV